MYANQPTCRCCIANLKNKTKRNNSKTPRLLEIQTMSPYYPVCPVSNAEWYPCVAKTDQKTPFGKR
jgi:hypothetical protein